MSMLHHPKRRSRTGPNDGPMAGAREENGASVHEYKRCMEQVTNENPGLSFGARQQLALERCSKANAERAAWRRGNRRSEPGGILRGVISRLRLGKDRVRAGSAPPAALDDAKLVALDVDDAIGLTSASSGRDGSECDVAKKRRAFAIRVKSVANIASDYKNALRPSINLSESEDDSSLQDSLEDIEKPSNFFEEPPSWRGRRLSIFDRKSRRTSAVSELSDVDEDEECKSFDLSVEEGADFGGEDNRVSPDQKANPFDESISNILPVEIKLYLDNFKDNQKQKRLVSASREMTASSKNRDSESSFQFNHNESNCSSNLSSLYDSTNFVGDFSVWNDSYRERNN